MPATASLTIAPAQWGMAHGRRRALALNLCQ